MERLLIELECLLQKLPPCGALAQLGERGLCKPEVRGSIPLSSTTKGLFELCSVTREGCSKGSDLKSS